MSKIPKLPSPSQAGRLPLPTKRDLSNMVRLLKEHDPSGRGMKWLITEWHYERGLPVTKIAHQWGVRFTNLRRWLLWYEIPEIQNLEDLPVRSADAVRSCRLRRRQEARRSSAGSRTNKAGLKRDDDKSLDIFLEEIGFIPLLTAREEYELAHLVHNGEEADRAWAVHEMTESNLRFVVSVAKKYQGRGMSLADLIHEGSIGCMRAARRFDHTRGFRFISYAVWWIRQAILQALAEQSRIVRLPLNRVGVVSKVGKTTSALEQDLGRLPTEDEVASAIGIATEQVLEAQQLAHSHMSLDKPFDSGDSRSDSLYELLEDRQQPSPEWGVMDASLRLEIEKALDSLSPREAEVISLYFGVNRETALTLEEIGARFALTRERVRQIKEKALARLRHPSRSLALRAYIDSFDRE